MLSENKKKIIVIIAGLFIAMNLAFFFQAGTVSIITFEEKWFSSDKIDEGTCFSKDKVNSDKILEIRDDSTIESAGYWDLIGSPIFIDGDSTGVGAHNWEWVENQPWFGGGDGTKDTPYIIENITINGQGSGSCISIQDSNKHFIIRHCIVTNSGSGSSDAGINLNYTNNGQIINNICLFNFNGIYLKDSRSNIISGNIANSNDYGIAMGNSNNNTILGNTANNNNFRGIKLTLGENNIISGNTANNNDYGILVLNCNNNTISGNTVINNDYGIYASSFSDAIVTGNTANKNDYGIYLGSSIDNTVSGNTANNNDYGIYLMYNCYYNIISGNTANNNDYGIYFENCGDNTVSGNTANDNRKAGIILDESYNINLSGNIMTESGLFIIGDPEQCSSHSIDTTNTINGKYIYYYANKIGLEPADFTNAGQVLLVNCKDSIISNLNISHGSIGIFLFHSNNNSISNCNVSYNAEYGIYLFYSNNNNLSGNTANNNNDYGIYLDQSNDNTLLENTINNNENDGIMLLYSSFNNISFNNASFNGDDGIHLTYSNDNLIYNNDAFNNSLYGIGLTHASDKNTIENNRLVDNHNRGLCIYTLCKENIDINNIEYRTFEPDPGASEAYALLIGTNGDPSRPFGLRTHLLDKFKIKNENIIILTGGMGGYETPTTQTVYEAFDYISKLIDSNDVFFFHILVHGGPGGNYLMNYFSYYYGLFNEKYSLQEYLDKIHCAEQYIFIESCYAGSYNDEIPPSLSTENRYLISSCKADQLTWMSASEIFFKAFESPRVFQFQNGDYNKDGFVDFNEAYLYMDDYFHGDDQNPVLSDGIYNTINNPKDGIGPVIADVSKIYSEGNKHIDLNFTIDGIGYVKSINVWLINNRGELNENISVPVIYSKNGGQGRYYFSNTTSQVIITYFIQVRYEYSDRNIVYNRYIDNDHDCCPDWTDFIDSDGDGLSDFREERHNTDPQDEDSDDDGLTDGQEVNKYLTDPNDNDSDDDGFSDGYEIEKGTDPLNPREFPKESSIESKSGGNGGNEKRNLSKSEIFVIAFISAVSIIGIISIVSLILIKKRLKRLYRDVREYDSQASDESQGLDESQKLKKRIKMELEELKKDILERERQLIKIDTSGLISNEIKKKRKKLKKEINKSQNLFLSLSNLNI